jgi:hypothetical protein
MIFHSWPAFCIWAAAVLLAFFSARGKHAGAAAFCGVLCGCAVILLILMAGGTLPEGLACLLPILYLLLPKETRHEL